MTRFLEDMLGWLIFDGIPIVIGCGWMLLAFVGIVLLVARHRKAAAWVGGIALLWLTVLLSVDFVFVRQFAPVKNNFHLVKPGMTEAEVLAILGDADMVDPPSPGFLGNRYYEKGYFPKRTFGHPKAEFPFWTVRTFELRLFGSTSSDYVVNFDPDTMKVVSTRPGDP